jgi:MoaA/NifB/PqqE/SkfB family radical SAM enzyme
MLYHYNDIKTIHLEVTERCNLSCPMCARNINGGETNPWIHDAELSLEDIKKIFPNEFIQQLNHMYMCGNFGDPIVAKDTLEIFRHFRSMNSDILLSMNTHGSARQESWWVELASILGDKGYVIFSIDGLDDTNDLYRRGSDFTRIMKNAKAFIEAGGNAHWEYLVFAHNEHQVDRARDLAETMGFTKFQLKKSARFFSSVSGSIKDTITGVDKKQRELKLQAPTNPEYRNAAVEELNGVGIVKQNVKLPTTKQEILNLIRPEIFHKDMARKSASEKLLDSVNIKCKVKEEKSLYVTAEGILQPCCWVAGQMYNWYNTPKGSQIWKLINVVGKDSLNALNNSIEHIVMGEYFQTLISDSWTKPSCAEGKLQVCSKICGTEIFSKQYT